ncbi:hypothetical protein HUG15_20725 [Salicibibacter cibarius]|uniref:Uncharacterized protein n=1 Tax=Salicibibacter cibarius TaxID=2743000 RepID=A0A7T7CDW7_9BACI|nr:hypothetical protein HUG15_20725 [Salicibibacter cibarius]
MIFIPKYRRKVFFKGFRTKLDEK